MTGRILIIGSGLLGKFLHFNIERSTICSHLEWRNIYKNTNPDIVINCAALTGQKACEEARWKATMDANVYLPCEIEEQTEKNNQRLILFSTEGVYKPHPYTISEQYYTGTWRKETDKLYAPNLYVISKLLMEQHCQGKNTIIFRLSRVSVGMKHQNDFVNQIKNWKFVHKTWQTLATADVILDRITASMKRPFSKSGIYNLAGLAPIYLPQFVTEHHKEPSALIEDIPPNMTPAHCLDTTKGMLI